MLLKPKQCPCFSLRIRSSEPKVVGSSPTGCIHKSLLRNDLERLKMDTFESISIGYPQWIPLKREKALGIVPRAFCLAILGQSDCFPIDKNLPRLVPAVRGNMM
jgi:hypothetical protein